ncbi:MAG TPA: hypothetical protein ENJ25_02250 [Firmicutes bacterium]|nr:hypothetical protein [Bacillota bacterium]
MKTIYNINPSVKMAVIFLYVGFLLFNMNYGFNLSILILSFSFIAITVRNLKSLVSLIIAVILFSSTIFIMNFLYYTKGQTPVNFLFLHGTYEGMKRGVVLSMRASSIIFLSVGYLFSTDPFLMIQSFIQNLHIPEKIGYALLIAFREIHLFKKNITNIERAMIIRNGGGKITLNERIKMIVPVFAMVVRKGERSAIALETRGMLLEKRGGYYRDMNLRSIDKIFVIISLLLLLVILFISSLLM